ncbi:hypothetical protein [Oceanibacterium hippocampi]|uniref:Yip1 domain protein n=1 Tax=Oceanibacterium hippocampi TaxID=745714 RepID=A0A1Y5RUA8_9PROT|nr:hypothetical protein [Oceanibacterium hippocampi]SLN25288.1 hypothetical protein OCH7691_00721 [Oceanibacterium hippocampi]
MPTLREALLSLYGVWRLAHLDPKGLGCFDASFTGFWRSFGAAIYAAPLFLLIILLRAVSPLATDDGSTATDYLVAEFVAYSLDWIAFPAVMAVIAWNYHLKHVYVRYIVAYNWCKAAIIGAVLLYTPIIYSGILSEGLLAMAIFLVQGILLFFLWFVTRSALGVTPVFAGLLVAVETLVSLLLLALTGRLLG